MDRTSIAGILLFIVLIAGWSIYGSSSRAEAIPPEDMRFSNTQEWSRSLSRHLPEFQTVEQRAVTSAYLSAIELPPPPANTSMTTVQELRTLHEYASTLREAALADIEAEHASFAGQRFGGTYPWKGEGTRTRELLDDILKETMPVIMTLKWKFDRVRPSYLDPTLTTAFPVPEHPAYPSGHSTQAHLIAGILSILDPDNTDAYFRDAVRIARNREIAGVHYPSDGAAGAALAVQLLPLYLATERGQELLEAARTEWELR